MKVLIKNVRIRFASIFEPTLQPGAKEPKFGIKAIIEPGSENAKILEAAMATVAKEKWKDKAPNIEASFVRTGKKPDVCFVKEPYKNKDGEAYGGFEDMFYLTASAKQHERPKVVDLNPKIELTKSDGKPYDGCYTNLSVEIWPQDNDFGRAIRAQLKGVQFVKHGDAFGGSPPSDGSEFEVLESVDEDFV